MDDERPTVHGGPPGWPPGTLAQPAQTPPVPVARCITRAGVQHLVGQLQQEQRLVVPRTPDSCGRLFQAAAPVVALRTAHSDNAGANTSISSPMCPSALSRMRYSARVRRCRGRLELVINQK